MEMMERPDPRQAKILPVVHYSAAHKAARAPDYWDHATLLELAVLARDTQEADVKLGEARMVAEKAWELESTVANLFDIRMARETRGEDCAWIEAIENSLLERARSIEGNQTVS
jgi:MAP3K TRAFs-binding domain